MRKGKANCFYCGRTLKAVPPGQKIDNPRKGNWWTKDHLIPRCRIGVDIDPSTPLLHKTVDACVECNIAKGHLTLEEYRLVLTFRALKGQPCLLGVADMVPIKFITFHGEKNGAK